MIDRLIKSLFTTIAIKQCAEKLQKNKNADAYETQCGGLLIGNNEDVQVKVIVTRKKDDFLEEFDVVEHCTSRFIDLKK